ncbi:unnamed protein product, partial [Allacma fusca]
IRNLSTLGGSDLTAIVNNILKKVLTYAAASRFNFTGINGKICFSSLSFNEIIYEAAIRNHVASQETQASVRVKVMKWLQHSTDKLPKPNKHNTAQASI